MCDMMAMPLFDIVLTQGVIITLLLGPDVLALIIVSSSLSRVGFLYLMGLVLGSGTLVTRKKHESDLLTRVVEFQDGNVVLQNSDLYHYTTSNMAASSLMGMVIKAEDFLAEYGWSLLILTICVIVLIHYLSKKRASQVSKRSSNETAQDPALIVRRQEALEASRRRLQEDLDAKAAEYKEKQKKLEEEKRKQKIEIWESMQEGKSYKAKNSSQAEEASSSSGVLKPKSDNKLRGSGYNPLAGDGGASVSWRPGRRGPTSGG